MWVFFRVIEGTPIPQKLVRESHGWTQYTASWGRKWNFPLGGARIHLWLPGHCCQLQQRGTFGFYVSASKVLYDLPHGLSKTWFCTRRCTWNSINTYLYERDFICEHECIHMLDHVGIGQCQCRYRVEHVTARNRKRGGERGSAPGECALYAECTIGFFSPPSQWLECSHQY